MATVTRILSLALCLAAHISAGISCPQGCEQCDPTLGCLASRHTQSQSNAIFSARFLTTCPDLCTSCDQDECLDCKLNASISLSACVCDANYFKSNKQCSPCSSLCLTCNQATGCTQCKPNSGGDPTDCSCVSGYRLNNNECVQCTDPLCHTCDSLGLCSMCKPHAGSDTDDCQCQSGYYQSGNECVPCNQSLCSECDSNGTCTVCDQNAEGFPNCVCKSGYYVSNGQCTQCDQLCHKCDKLGCFECIPNAGLDPSNCQCESGYYSQNNECIACTDPLCDQCTSAECTRCKSNTDLNVSSCACNSGYYKFGRDCLSCPSVCVSCLDNVGCVSCISGYYKYQGTCLECSSLCTTCTDEVGCQGCKENAGNDENDCECKTGYFENDSQACALCTDDLCLTCSSAEICQECVPNATKTNSGCACDIGYMEDAGECVPCPYLCAECTMDECTACMPNAGSDLGNCDCDIYYFNSGNQCVHCSDLCLACGSNGCNICKEHAVRTDGICKCKEGYYEKDGVCHLCTNSLCSTCTELNCSECKANAGSDPTNCQCARGFYKRDEECVKCADSLCDSCTSEGCNECTDNAGDLADCRCLTGYYEENEICVECSNLCADCTLNGCQECKPHAGWDLDDCTCEEGYYETNNHCASCSDILCGICNSNSCTTCSPNASKVADVCTCNSGFYQLLNECVEYPALTATVNSEGLSITCVSNADLLGVICVCNTGYYQNGNMCISCGDSLCDECNYLGCIQCASNADNLENCTCIDGFYELSGVCTKCSPLCKDCDPDLGCLKCKSNAGSDINNCECASNYWFYENQCIQCSELCEACPNSGCTDCKANAGNDPTNCVCQSGYYENVDVCTACSTTYDLCTECTSTGCTSCVSSAELSNNLCVCKPNSNNTDNPESCVCNTTHYLSADGTACVECPANSTQDASNVNTCLCHSGYFKNVEGTACVACSGLCATCSSATHCLSCKTNAITDLANPNQCICPSTYKLSAAGNACETCQANSAQSGIDSKVCACNTGYHLNSGSCVECIVDYSLCNVCSDSECTSCVNNSSRSGSGCACDSGYYTYINYCKACTDTYNYCLQCSTSECTQCIAHAEVSGTHCVCIAGYYMNNGQCSSCPALCSTCGSSGVCTQCKSNAVDNGAVCVCSQGYVASGGSCVSCSDSLCLTCTDSGCTQCKSNSSNTSNCSCNSGYYESAGACVSCTDTLCDVCSPASTCTQCKSNASGVSDCSCNSGYYESGGSCLACTDSLCDVCSPATTCSQCKGNASNTNDCSCEIGYYEAGGLCHACDNTLCKTCNPNNLCTECKDNASNTSNCSCNSGYYLLAGACVACSDPLCADCDPSGVCTDCKDYAGDDPNSCSCVQGYYLNNNQCTACPSLCKSCNALGICLECKLNAGSDLTNCSCVKGYFEETNQCSACHSLCEDCTSTNCNTCVVNSTKLEDTFHCGCNSNYYKMGSACLLKNTLCSSYIDDLGCQICKPNAGEDENNCLCQNGYYISSNSCANCPDLCSNCDPVEGCKACKANSGADPLNCQCVEGYFKSGLECSVCGSLCKACTSLGCSVCKANTNGNTSNCLCSAGYYASANECVVCPKLCKECTGVNSCTSCEANSELKNGDCVCVDGFYYDLEAKTCLGCNGLCETCSSATACLSCKANAGVDPINCQCQGRYLNVNNVCVFQCPNDCATCSTTSHECYSCKAEKFYWPEVKVCYSSCPTGYTTSQVTVSGNSVSQCQLSNPFIYSSEFTNFQTTKTSNSISLVGTNITPQYKRGWYYNGSSYATFQNKITYGTTFYIEFWVRMDDIISQATLISKYNAADKLHLYIQNSVLHLNVNTEAYDASYSTSEKTVSFTNILLAKSWYHYGLAIGLSNTKRSTITLYSNDVQSFSTTLESGYILDELISSSLYVIGAHYKASSNISSYFKGFIGYIKTENGPYTPTVNSGNCVSSANCLSSCDITHYPSSSACAPCLTGCTTGCANPDKCSVSIDPLCKTFSNFETCTVCDDYSYLLNGVCTCKVNSSYEAATNACKCNTDYTAFSGQCVLCRDYLTSSDVTGAYNSDYSAIILTFSRALTNKYISSCADLFKTDTYAKIGSKSTCVFSVDRLKITVTLGADSTYINEQLVINELNVVGEKTPCRTDPTDIKINVSTTTAPELVAVLEAPEIYSKACGSSSFTIKGEKSRFIKRFNITYTWSATGTGVTSDLTSFLATQTSKNIVIEPSYLKAGNAIFSLTVGNSLTNTNTASKTITVVEQRLLTVNIDAGQNLELVYGTSVRLAGFVSKKCDTTGPFTYVWTLAETSNAAFINNSAVFTQSNNAITLLGSTLPAGYTYKFNVAVSETSGLTGSNAITLNIKYPNLIAKLNKPGGIISKNSDLTLSASASSDPSGNDLTFTWECYISGSPCKDTTGATIEFGDVDNITITSVNLIAGVTYNLGVTISTLDGRSASASIEMEAIDSPPNSIKLDSPPKSSHQLSLIINSDIESPDGSTFKWDLISGPNIPNNEANSQVPILQFSRNTLIEGGEYNYELSILNPNLIGKATLTFTINDGPKAGTFNVNPSSGIELTDRFYYTADEFYDGDEADYPLKYSYFYKIANGEEFQLKAGSFSNTYSSYLNSLAVEVGVTVCDAIPTCMSISQSVTVTSASVRMLQDDILSRYYESIEDDEDIPGVTSIFATSGLIDAETTYLQIKATFENFMESLENNQFNREIYYSIFKAFLTDEKLISNDEILDYLNTCNTIINKLSDNSLGEAEDIYAIFSPSISSRSSDSQFIAQALDYLKSIHWYTIYNNGPTPYSTDLIEDSYLNVRAFGEDFLGQTVRIQGLNITCPEDLQHALEIFNVYTEIIQTDDLPIITLFLSSVGELDKLNLILYDEEVPYTKSDSEFMFVFEFPYSGTMNTTTKKVVCDVYSSTNRVWEESECESELVDGKMKIQSQSVGSINFRVIDVDVPIDPPVDPPVDPTITDDDEDCDVNPAPFVIVGLWFGMLFVIIVVMILIKINRPHLIKSNLNTMETGKTSSKRRHKHGKHGKHEKDALQDLPPNSPDEIVLVLASSREIIPEKEKESEEKIDYSIMSYLKLHVLVEIFKDSPILYKLSHVISVFNSMYLGHALIGAIMYSLIDIDDNSDDTFTDIANDAYPDDAKFIFIALGIIIPVALPLRFLVKIDKKEVTIPAIAVTLVVMIGSMLGILLMGAYYCKAAVNRWTLAYLIYIPLELTISESIIAAVLFVAGKR